MMGACSSSSVATSCGWTVDEVSTTMPVIGDVLTERQVQLVRDTWDLVHAIDAETSEWTTAFSRYCHGDKELNRIFNHVDDGRRLVSPPGDENTNDERRAISSCSNSRVDDVTAAPFRCESSCSALRVAPGDHRQSTLLLRHSEFVMETIGAAVECLDLENSAVFSEILIALGQIHATFNVKQHYLSPFWSMVRRCLRDVLGPKSFNDEADRAWQAAFGFIVARMRDGIRAHRQVDYAAHITSSESVSGAEYNAESRNEPTGTHANSTTKASPITQSP